MKTDQERHIIESWCSKSKSHRVLATGHQRQLQTLTDLTDLRTRRNLTIEYRYSMKTDQERHIIESRYSKSKSHRVSATGHQWQLHTLTDLTNLRTLSGLGLEHKGSRGHTNILWLLVWSRSHQTCHQTHKSHAAELSADNYWHSYRYSRKTAHSQSAVKYILVAVSPFICSE